MKGGTNLKTIGVGLSVLFILIFISLYIYAGVEGTKNLSWQTIFFILITVLVASVTSGFIGFKAGRGFLSAL